MILEIVNRHPQMVQLIFEDVLVMEDLLHLVTLLVLLLGCGLI